jgi:hypothetical protein
VSRSARPARTVAVAVCAAAGVLLTAACSPTTTTIQYSASDGARVPLTPQLRGLNLMVVAEEEGAQGNVLGALSNRTDEAVTFTLEADGAAAVDVPVPANGTVYLGTEGGTQVMLDSVGVIPGENLDATLSAGDAQQQFYLPVLDGTLPEYAEYVP